MGIAEALDRLIENGWNVQAIADETGMHRSSIYRLIDTGRAKYYSGTRIVDLAKSGRKPPKDRK